MGDRGMCKLLEVSDLHWEYQADHGFSQSRELANTDADIIILAGDVCPAKYIEDYFPAFENLATRYGSVLYTPGNHEYYGISFKAGMAKLKSLETRFPNITILQNKVVQLGTIKIAGTTLWFPFDVKNNIYKRYMDDFKLIHENIDAYYQENTKAKDFLTANQDVDIVVTHHIPTEHWVTDQYKGHFLNRFFVGGAMRQLYDSNAKVFIFGHTHESFYHTWDEGRGKIEVFCNPFGYAQANRLNPNFNWKLIVEV
jgi:predicted phosphohydrolase